MAKFCIHCGKPLAEGEVCSCRQTTATSSQPQGNDTSIPQGDSYSTNQGAPNPGPAPQGNFQGNPNPGPAPQRNYNQAPNFGPSSIPSQSKLAENLKDIFGSIVPIFKDPVKQTKSISDKNNKTIGISMICVNIVVTLIMMCIFALYIKNKLGVYSSYLNIPYAEIILGLPILTAIIYFALSGLLFLCAKSIFHGNVEYANIVAIIGVKAIIDICFLVVGIILMFISPQFGAIIILIGSVYSLLVMLFSFGEIVNISGSKKVYSMLIALAGMLLIYYILYSVLLSDKIDSLTHLFNF